MSEIPSISIDEPYVLTEGQREQVAAALDELARKVRAGLIGNVHAGATSTRQMVEPLPGMHMLLVFTRPGPLPPGSLALDF